MLTNNQKLICANVLNVLINHKIVILTNLQAGLIEHCTPEKLAKNKDLVLNLSEIVVPHSDMPTADGMIDCQEWAVGLLTEPKKYIHATQGGQFA